MGWFWRGEIDRSHSLAPFIGRVLISLIFLIAGIGKIFAFEAGVESLIQMGVSGAAVFLFLGMVFELLGGLLILLGWLTRFGCWILMVFLLPTTLIFHGFWNYDGPQQALQFSLFLKNLTIYGGLTLLVSYGPGRWSLDAVRSSKH